MVSPRTHNKQRANKRTPAVRALPTVSCGRSHRGTQDLILAPPQMGTPTLSIGRSGEWRAGAVNMGLSPFTGCHLQGQPIGAQEVINEVGSHVCGALAEF